MCYVQINVCMLWKTHIRISNEVLRRLNVNLPSDVYSKFKEGLLAPDQWQDYPHHYGKSGAIQSNLQQARQYFLQSNHQESFFYLGVALHYIQDAYTSIIAYNSPHNQEWHHNYEQSIENSDFVYNIEDTLPYFFKDDNYQLSKYSNIASQLSQNIEGKYETLRVSTIVGANQSQKTGKPTVDLNLALKACLAVSQSVISSKNNSQLDLTLKQSLLKHENLLHGAELSSSEEIINLAGQVENLKRKRVTKPGFIVRLRNGFLSLRVKMKELGLKNKYNGYIQRKHLQKVYSNYGNEISGIISPHVGWYNYFIPELNLNIVKNELIPIQDSNGTLSGDIAKLVNSGRINSYRIGNHKVVLRRELNQRLV
jgi:hypothetical protein